MKPALIESNSIILQAEGLPVETETLPTFTLTAYTGGPVSIPLPPNYPNHPVVFDLADTQIAPMVPCLFAHTDTEVVGHANDVLNTGSEILATAVLSGTSDRANEIRDTSNNGYQWQLSVGIAADQLDFLPEGESAFVNNRTMAGPLYLARKAVLREISFVSIGADANTSAILNATFMGASTMDDTWISSMGFDPTTLTPEQKATLQQLYDLLNPTPADPNATTNATAAKAAADAAVVAAKASGATNLNAMAVVVLQAAKSAIKPITPAPVPTPTPAPVPTPSVDPVAAMRTNTANELNRIQGIGILAAKYKPQGGNIDLIQSNAVANGWSLAQTEVEMLKASRPVVQQGGGTPQGNAATFQMLAAALAVASRVKNADKLFTAPILEAAHKKFRGRMGVQQFLLEAAIANGYRGGYNVKADLRNILQAAFSTFDTSTILATNINFQLRDGYMSVDDSWRKLAAITSVANFMEQTTYMGTGAFVFEPVAPDGKIKHGTQSDQNFGNKIDTYGKMFAYTRQDIYNDNLGLLDQVPRRLGRGGALKLVKSFWTEFMNNSTFFASGNHNVFTGALSLAGLNAGLAAFRKLKDPDGEYIGGTPKYVVVPTELEATATALYSGSTLITGESQTIVADNSVKGKLEPIVSPYLSDSAYTGYSTTAFYIVADPADVPVMEVAFLDGQETPTVESADVDFSQLGIQFRGFFDFGVRKQDPNGGVRSPGT
jgi:phage major head subunit gpT-like protein